MISNVKLLRQMMMFACIGAVNTLVHAGAVIIAIEVFVLNQVSSNVIGFFLANLISYVLNSKYTFLRDLGLKAYLLFVFSSLNILALTLLFSSLSQFMGWHYLVGLALVLFVSPLLSFFVNKRFVFK